MSRNLLFSLPFLFQGYTYIITVVYRQSTPSWEKRKKKRIKLMSFASSPIIDKCQSSLPPKESRFNSAVGLARRLCLWKLSRFNCFACDKSKRQWDRNGQLFGGRGGTMWNSFFWSFVEGIWQRDTWRTITRPSLFITPQQNTRNYGLWLLLLHGRAGTGECRYIMGVADWGWGVG